MLVIQRVPTSTAEFLDWGGIDRKVKMRFLGSDQSNYTNEDSQYEGAIDHRRLRGFVNAEESVPNEFNVAFPDANFFRTWPWGHIFISIVLVSIMLVTIFLKFKSSF